MVVVSSLRLRTTFWNLKKEYKVRWHSYHGDYTMRIRKAATTRIKVINKGKWSPILQNAPSQADFHSRLKPPKANLSIT